MKSPLINFLLIILIVIIVLNMNNNMVKVKQYMSNLFINDNDYNVLSKKDTSTLYSFLNEHYKNILLPKNINFIKNNNKYKSQFTAIINGSNVNINIEFIPNDIYVTKYNMFGLYGSFNLINNNNNHNNNHNNDNHNNDIDIDIESDTDIISTENILDGLL